PFGNRNAAIVEAYSENSVCVQFAEMTRNVDDAVQAYRLHSSALARQELTLLHALSEVEVVVHVFGIHSKPAAEIHAACYRRIKRVPNIASDIVAANAKSEAGAIGKTI